jgi:hypothetical protein
MPTAIAPSAELLVHHPGDWECSYDGKQPKWFAHPEAF